MEELKSPIDEEIDQAIKLKEETDSVKARIGFCAFKALEENKLGKELMDNLKLRLYVKVGIQEGNTLSYIEGQNDMIRMLLSMIHEHKNQ